MARRLLRILPYKGNRDYHYYLDGLKVNGKRRRLFFTSEAEAKEELKKWDKRVRRFVAGFSDRAIQTLTVREIEDRLHGLDLSPQTVFWNNAVCLSSSCLLWVKAACAAITC